MSTMGIIIVLIVLAVVVALGALWAYSARQKKSRLRDKFGTEYDRTVRESGDEKSAGKELEQREKRVERLHLKDIPVEDRRRYEDEWRLTQAHFVDNPGGAIGEADELLGTVMEQRGFPIADFEQQAADVSVLYPDVVSNYRRAHAIAVENEGQAASTEDLRQAMVHYRSLFDELVGATAGAQGVSSNGGKR